MTGIQVSQKTMRGEQETIFRHRFPPKDEVAAIFPLDARSMNYVHYNTADLDTLAEQLVSVTELVGEKLHGFQLNLAWPPASALETYRSRYPEIGIVLQMGNAALAHVGHSPEAYCDWLQRDYSGLVDYILIDPGGGYGYPLDPEVARLYLREMNARRLDIDLAVAGGIAANSMHLVQPLLAEFPNISFDSEAPLRDSEDRMELDKARDYLLSGMALFSQVKDQ